MCEPVSTSIALAAAAMKIGGAVVDATAQNKQHNAVKDSAMASLQLQDNELSLREVQDRIAGSEQIDQGNRAVAATEGQETASAASRGVGGVSIDLLLGDAQAQGARYKQSVQDNTDAEVNQLENNKLEAAAQAKARIAGAPAANPFLTGLRIGGAALDAYSTISSHNPAT